MTKNSPLAEKKTASLPRPLFIDTPATLNTLRHTLKGCKSLAVDTESNSLHAYRAQVCLIQISANQQDFLLDPLALDGPHDLDFLGELFADPTVEKIFHAAEYDVMTMHRDMDFTFSNIFDTMIAARVLGWDRFGLGTILKDHYGITVNKKHQRANWGQRPLPSALIRYAQMDTHFLHSLREKLYNLLEEGGHLEEAQEMFDEVCMARWNGTDFDPEGYWRISHARDLAPREIAILKELYLYRESEAEKRDVPVFKILSDSVLLALARSRPQSQNQLRKMRVMSDLQMRRYTRGVLTAIREGGSATPPRPPRRNGKHTDEATIKRYETLHTWRKERAAQRGVSSEIIISKDALWEIAREAPHTIEEIRDIPHLGPWRAKTYGAEILALLKESD